MLPSIKDKQNSTNWKDSFSALKNVPRFLKKIHQSSPVLFALNLIARLMNSAAPILMLWIGKLLIDEIILQINCIDNWTEGLAICSQYKIWLYVGLEFGIAILSDILGRFTGLTDGLLGDLYANKSSVELINKTQEVELQQLEDPEFYDKLARARQQTTSRVNLMSNILNQVQDIVIIISLITGLIVFEPLLVILLVISIIPSFVNEIKFSRRSYSLARSWTAERRELDYLRFIGANDKTAKEVKLFGLADFLSSRFAVLSDKYYLENRKLAVQRTALGATFNILGVLAYYGAYILIIYRVLSKVLSIGELTFLSGSFSRLRNSLQSVFARFSSITESALYLQDYFDFLDISNERSTEFDLRPLPKDVPYEFEFINVKFAYPTAEEEVLKSVSFTLKAGEKMAFVGENGAGKTTLIKLLLRFYDPTDGKILLNGVDIRHYNKNEYQQFFGVIFQDFVKYEFTVKENIAVGKIDQLENEEKIRKAAEQSLAKEVIDTLPEQYDQQLGMRFKRGKELSGGQWQKIALARAYMKDAGVLILDEPTSALDARAEYEAFLRFIALTKGKTAVIISHRFSTVRMADRILVLSEGKVLEIGTHEELMASDQLYAELFLLQAAGYN